MAPTTAHPDGAWALALALVFLAHSADNPQLAAIGRTTLQAVLG